jgi:hypothetical protein
LTAGLLLLLGLRRRPGAVSAKQRR